MQLFNQILTPRQIEEKKNSFQQNHFLRIQELINKEFLNFLLIKIEKSPELFKDNFHFEKDKFHLYQDEYESFENDSTKFHEIKEDKIGHEQTFTDAKLYLQLNIIQNNPDFLSLIKQITGKENINSVETRIAKLKANSKMEIDWHDDSGKENRQVGMRIELSKNNFQGGIFQMRRKNSTDKLIEPPKLEFGDILIFDIDEDKLEHRVTPIIGNESRLSIISWFYSE